MTRHPSEGCCAVPRGNLTDEYVFFDGERVARKSTNGVFYYFSDHLKTASVITDASGNIKSESDFYPWGGELQFANNDSNHYKFTGKERDSETQLDYFGARYYSNGLGRFVTPDWAAKATAVPYAEFSDPQSLNLYTYVRNIPTARFDADGHVQQIEDQTCLAQNSSNSFSNHVEHPLEALKGYAKGLVNDAFRLVNRAAGINGDAIPLTNHDQVVGARAASATLAVAPALAELKPVMAAAEVVDMEATVRAPSVITPTPPTVAEGSFSIIDWSGYPSNLPQPTGPFRLLEGTEYIDARSAANVANRAMHAADPSLDGMHIHEIQPVKFGGSPTDMANKIPLPPADHATATTFWNRIMRDLQP